jgi:hypothetical protein
MALGAMWAYVLHAAQQWKALPWVTQKTTALNITFRIVASFFTGIGIHGAYTGNATQGWQIAIAIPSLAVLGHTLVQMVGQYALQQGWLTALQVQKFVIILGNQNEAMRSTLTK